MRHDAQCSQRQQELVNAAILAVTGIFAANFIKVYDP
jgi:hypothetical protein